MVNSENFAQRLHEIMEFYGLTASAFAEKIGFNKSGISHLLSGRNKPSLEFVIKVLSCFPEVRLYWLLNGTGSFPAKDEPEKQASLPLSAEKGEKFELNTGDNSPDIEQIIVFYKNGSFKKYFPAQNKR